MESELSEKGYGQVSLHGKQFILIFLPPIRNRENTYMGVLKRVYTI